MSDVDRMRIRFITSCFVMFLGLVPTHGAGPYPRLRFTNGSILQQQRMLAAIDRFRDIGLKLPSLTVSFFSDRVACEGHQGLFRSGEVLICSPADFVYEHELAHAWIAEYVDEQLRCAFMALRGHDNWFDPARPWSERGGEDAAFIIQQGLLAQPLPPVLDGEWLERLESFYLLTGRESPRLSIP